MTAMSSYLSRYILFTYPLIFLCGTYAIVRFYRKLYGSMLCIITALFLLTSIFSVWTPITHRSDDDLSLFRVVQFQRSTLRNIGDDYGDALVLVNEPAYAEFLRNPLYGYSKKNSIEVYDWNMPGDYYVFRDMASKQKKRAIIVFSPDAYDAYLQMKQKILSEIPSTPILYIPRNNLHIKNTVSVLLYEL